MKKHFLAVAALCFLGTSWAQRKIEYVEYDLPNGLHVILHEEHATPIVAVSVLYHVGSKNENPDRTGFAHFFEHLLFEGSTNIGRGEYSELVEKNGGTLNANTSQDRTYYYEILPSNQLELGLWLESERLLHARVDKTGIETQRQVVKEEKRQRVDNQPYGSFMTEMFGRMFEKHPYSWAPIGSMEHLDAAQEADYVNFYRTFYVPSNAVLSIAGDINIEQTKKWINQYYGSIPSGQAINLLRDHENLTDQEFETRYGLAKSKFDKTNIMASKDPEAQKVLKKYSAMQIAIPKPAPERVEPPLTKVVVDTVYDNIQLPAVFIGYRFPEQTHPDAYAIEMMNSILSGSTSSRMNKNIVEKKQQAVAAFSFAFSMEDPGLGIVAAIGANGVDVKTIEQSLDEEIEALQNELISQEEFEKVRNQFENDLVSSNSSVAGIAENLADSHTYRGNANMVNSQLDKYLSVTRDDIQRVAKKYFTKNSRVILYYLPKETN
ncbi:MAG: peptidase [Crocinitomicaceae bacterium]|jgi:predicted Zn-dependent peptidase|nr:peptidase [Crocinitomicaceae bacterium]